MGLAITLRHLPLWRHRGTVAPDGTWIARDRSWRVPRTGGSLAGAGMRFGPAVQVHGLLARAAIGRPPAGVACCRGWHGRVRRPGHGSAWFMVKGSCLQSCAVQPPEPTRTASNEAAPAMHLSRRGSAALAGRRVRSREPRLGSRWDSSPRDRCMGSWRACGDWRCLDPAAARGAASKKDFTADAGRCTLMHADGTRLTASVRLIRFGRAVSAVDDHAGFRPICVHPRVSACICGEVFLACLPRHRPHRPAAGQPRAPLRWRWDSSPRYRCMGSWRACRDWPPPGRARLVALAGTTGPDSPVMAGRASRCSRFCLHMLAMSPSGRASLHRLVLATHESRGGSAVDAGWRVARREALPKWRWDSSPAYRCMGFWRAGSFRPPLGRVRPAAQIGSAGFDSPVMPRRCSRCIGCCRHARTVSPAQRIRGTAHTGSSPASACCGWRCQDAP